MEVVFCGAPCSRPSEPAVLFASRSDNTSGASDEAENPLLFEFDHAAKCSSKNSTVSLPHFASTTSFHILRTSTDVALCGAP